MLGIEITNVCNYKCYFCGARNVVDFQIINTETFKKIVDDACELGIEHIKLTPSNGEIFTDKDIINKLKYIEDSTIKTCMFHTNFSLTTPDVQDIIIHFKKLEIHVSDYGVGVSEDFQFMTQMKDSMFLKYQKNLEYSKKIGLNLIMNPRGRDYEFSYDNDGDDTLLDIYRDNISYAPKLDGLCHQMYMPRILSNGNMAFCTCSGDGLDMSEDQIIGNIYTSSLKDLYLHPSRLKLINDMKMNCHPDFCKDCANFTKTFNPTISVLKNLARIKNENRNIK